MRSSLHALKATTVDTLEVQRRSVIRIGFRLPKGP
ncbi:unnamed protein product [Brassica oleracea var. botrytis]